MFAQLSVLKQLNMQYESMDEKKEKKSNADQPNLYNLKLQLELH